MKFISFYMWLAYEKFWFKMIGLEIRFSVKLSKFKPALEDKNYWEVSLTWVIYQWQFFNKYYKYMIN